VISNYFLKENSTVSVISEINRSLCMTLCLLCVIWAFHPCLPASTCILSQTPGSLQWIQSLFKFSHLFVLLLLSCFVFLLTVWQVRNPHYFPLLSFFFSSYALLILTMYKTQASYWLDQWFTSWVNDSLVKLHKLVIINHNVIAKLRYMSYHCQTRLSDSRVYSDSWEPSKPDS